MKIQQTGMQNQITTGVKFQKKELGPQDGVSLGSTEKTPDFLQQPLVSQKSDAGAALGCAAVGGATGVVLGGTFGAIGGAVDAGIGWAASALFGETGGLVATGVMGLIGFAKGATGEKGNIVTGVIGAASNAGATYLGAKCGAMGLLYGGLVTGVPTAAIAGIGLATAGGAIGASA